MNVKFSWEASKGASLIIRITDGDRETTWKITKTTAVERLAVIFSEASEMLDPRQKLVGELKELLQSPVEEFTETDLDFESKAELEARVEALRAPGGAWFASADNELPLFEIGHGEPE